MMLYLVQTDTTVGFLAKDCTEIACKKGRSIHKPCVFTVASLSALREHVRVPHAFLNRVRRSTKTTFIIKNRAIRVVRNSIHKDFLARFGGLYSSSANKSGQEFCRHFAEKAADIIVFEKDNCFNECPASAIVKLNRCSFKRIR